MYELILTLHILICVILVIVILIQSGKSAGLGGIFGGGDNENLFSAPSGSAFIRKVTVGLAIGFLCTTLILTVLESRKTGRSVIERMGTPQQGQ